MTSLFQIATALEKGIKLTPTSSIIPKPAVKTTSFPSVLTTTNVNQNAVFGAINITPAKGGAGGGGGFSILSLFGGGGSGAGGGAGGGVELSQVYNPISEVVTEVSNVFTTTNTTSVSNVSNVSNITSSPFGGSSQTTTPSTTVTPTITPTQVATQTATPTITSEQAGAGGTGGGGGGGMEWWQYLLIGGVAIVGIYMITKAFKGRKKNG